MHTRLTPTLTGIFISLVLAVGMVMPVAAAHHDEGSFAVYHGPVEITLADASSDGHRLGDLRVASIDTVDADGSSLGRLEATLTTTAIDVPADGDEIRVGSLIFTFGENDEHQIVVDGSAHYPASGPTLASGDVTVRPIVGGSGKFRGVSGDAVTQHFDDDSWSHTFHFTASKAGATARDERKADRDERKAARDERKAARDAAKTARKSNRGGGAIDALYAADGVDETGVVRTDLGIAEPLSAPGEQLGLWHYTIPAGQELAPHTHPGWQLARVTAGEFEYTVISGEGELLRADGSIEPMGPGTYILDTGDGVIENPDLVHFGANREDEAVTLISATLYPTGAPLATLVEEPSSETASPAESGETLEASPAT